MTTKFTCNICDIEVPYDHNTVIIHAGKKEADICLECYPLIEQCIQEEHDWKIENKKEEKKIKDMTLNSKISNAINLLEENGYKISHLGDEITS